LRRGQRDVLVARHAVISTSAPTSARTCLGGEIRPGWRSAGRTMLTADLVLDRPIVWPHEGCRDAQRVYLVWEDWDRCLEWLQAAPEER
jgi:hypothetical protein